MIINNGLDIKLMIGLSEATNQNVRENNESYHKLAKK
jgi:hypothetical protein